MLAANPGKTPISLLQEYGTRIGKTPVYDLLKAEGQAHQPNFTFRVTVGDTSCTGEEGLGSLAGMCIHRARGLVSCNRFPFLFFKAREGWRFQGESCFLDWKNRAVRSWIGQEMSKGSATFTVIEEK